MSLIEASLNEMISLQKTLQKKVDILLLRNEEQNLISKFPAPADNHCELDALLANDMLVSRVVFQHLAIS